MATRKGWDNYLIAKSEVLTDGEEKSETTTEVPLWVCPDCQVFVAGSINSLGLLEFECENCPMMAMAFPDPLACPACGVPAEDHKALFHHIVGEHLPVVLRRRWLSR